MNEEYEPVIVESPYAGDTKINEQYGRWAMHDCLMRGEAPYASHLLYTQHGVLNDDDPAEREAGIRAGFAFRSLCKKTVVYEDLGISKGMRYGIEHAQKMGHPVEYRRLPLFFTREDVDPFSYVIFVYEEEYGWRATSEIPGIETQLFGTRERAEQKIYTMLARYVKEYLEQGKSVKIPTRQVIKPVRG